MMQWDRGSTLVASNGRKVKVMGRSALFADMTVAETENGATVLIYPTGYCPDLGRNVFIAENETEAASVAEAVSRSFGDTP